MADASLESLGSVFGWRVTVQQLCLEAEAYKYTRLLRLIRLRQSSSLPASLQGTFDFSRLPAELFNDIVDIVRQTAIAEAKVSQPYEVPALCSCAVVGDWEIVGKAAQQLADQYPDFQLARLDAGCRRRILERHFSKTNGADGLLSCMLSVLDTNWEECQRGWIEHWTKISDNVGVPGWHVPQEVKPVLGTVALMLRETGHEAVPFNLPTLWFDNVAERLEECKRAWCSISPKKYAFPAPTGVPYAQKPHEAWQGPIPGWLRGRYKHCALFPLFSEARYLMRPTLEISRDNALATSWESASDAVENVHDSASGHWKVVAPSF